MKHQEHFGKKFYKDHRTGYWISCKCPKIRAHRWVWQNIHGKIPQGYHIHHKDEDKSNNSIENLELIEQSRHLSLHMQCAERKRFSSENCEKIRPLTKAWHASEEGNAWHRAHGILGWANRSKIEIKCRQCEKIVETKTYHQEFCSNACKSKWRRDNGIDNIEKICPVCGVKYMENKYKKSKTCSRSCGKKKVKLLD